MNPPEMDPPKLWCPTEWVDEWRATVSYGINDVDRPVWIRTYRELDGHEECCNHTDIVVVPRESEAYIPRHARNTED